MAKNQTKAGTEVGQGRIENPKSAMNPGHSGTDPQKVKQEIQKDVNAGIGAMTSREAGSIKD
ncbi:hypothetical protein [Halobacillus aidingensis]|uniref:Uncharacterized protein n=1 Tax=Halobacillus aidingensis TaxID=240303 RepID=A0A1H0M018_HALAD|nr:hypothetical protein [Halobacillus aidingensis]SDO73809.1 hypothetical protein SAMN05421677_107183 [Halobacillus aidingensis]